MTRKVMRDSVKPALDKMITLMPTPQANPYSTGELKSLVRVKIVKDQYDMKALVGVRKKMTDTIGKNGKRKWNAGNRAHLTEFGPITGKRFWTHQPFKRPTEESTGNLVQSRMEMGMNAILEDEFKKEQ